MDSNNKLLNHVVVALLSAGLIYVFSLSGIGWNRSIAAASFVLLFLTLIIGPIMKLFRPIADFLPWDMPWSWRGELGIWFTILSIAHVYLVVSERQPASVFRIADYLGMVALFWALVLTAASFGKVIKFMGIKTWKWLHSFAYVLFYFAGAHTLNHAFLRTGRPDSWIHWSYAAMIAIVMLLQLSGFIREIMLYRKSLKLAPTKGE